MITEYCYLSDEGLVSKSVYTRVRNGKTEIVHDNRQKKISPDQYVRIPHVNQDRLIEELGKIDEVQDIDAHVWQDRSTGKIDGKIRLLMDNKKVLEITSDRVVFDGKLVPFIDTIAKHGLITPKYEPISTQAVAKTIKEIISRADMAIELGDKIAEAKKEFKQDVKITPTKYTLDDIIYYNTIKTPAVDVAVDGLVYGPLSLARSLKKQIQAIKARGTRTAKARESIQSREHAIKTDNLAKQFDKFDPKKLKKTGHGSGEYAGKLRTKDIYKHGYNPNEDPYYFNYGKEFVVDYDPLHDRTSWHVVSSSYPGD
jgi:hypothetical protein